MPAINFRKRYAKAIEAGVKRTTIRPPRRDKRPTAKEGDILSLYYGMRTKHCKLIRRVVCTGVDPIALDIERHPDGKYGIGIAVRGVPLVYEQLYMLAREDGFTDVSDMAEFFAGLYGTQMHGWLIRWNPETPTGGHAE